MEEVTINNDRVFLKGSNGNYRVVYPIKVDGKINWKNLLTGGSWWNLLTVAVILFILFGAINEYISNLKLTSACLRALPAYISLQPYLDNLNFTGIVVP
jgi:hypothetical protein